MSELLQTVQEPPAERTYGEQFSTDAGSIREIVGFLPMPAVINEVSNGQLLHVNQAALDCVNLAFENFLGSQTETLWENPSRHDAFLEILTARGIVENFETTLRNGRDGGISRIVVSARHINFENKSAILSVFKNIIEESPKDDTFESAQAKIWNETEERREALLRQELMFHEFIEHAPSAISVKDRDGKFLHMNHIGRQLFNVSQAAAREGRNFYEICQAEAGRILKEADDKVFETGKPCGIDEKIIWEGRGRSYKGTSKNPHLRSPVL